jgi:putative membrane protein
MINTHQLLLINAVLNATAATLVTAGYVSIRRRWVAVHRVCMVGALIVSTLFLASYTTYHWSVGSVAFTAQGWPRWVYYAILVTHIPLAAAIVPMALITAGWAVRGRFAAHVRLARWTVPVWLYVSGTGVLVYMMIYQWFPSSQLK